MVAHRPMVLRRCAASTCPESRDVAICAPTLASAASAAAGPTAVARRALSPEPLSAKILQPRPHSRQRPAGPATPNTPGSPAAGAPMYSEIGREDGSRRGRRGGPSEVGIQVCEIGKHVVDGSAAQHVAWRVVSSRLVSSGTSARALMFGGSCHRADCIEGRSKRGRGTVDGVVHRRRHGRACRKRQRRDRSRQEPGSDTRGTCVQVVQKPGGVVRLFEAEPPAGGRDRRPRRHTVANNCFVDSNSKAAQEPFLKQHILLTTSKGIQPPHRQNAAPCHAMLHYAMPSFPPDSKFNPPPSSRAQINRHAINHHSRTIEVLEITLLPAASHRLAQRHGPPCPPRPLISLLVLGHPRPLLPLGRPTARRRRSARPRAQQPPTLQNPHGALVQVSVSHVPQAAEHGRGTGGHVRIWCAVRLIVAGLVEPGTAATEEEGGTAAVEVFDGVGADVLHAASVAQVDGHGGCGGVRGLGR